MGIARKEAVAKRSFFSEVDIRYHYPNPPLCIRQDGWTAL